MAVQRLLEINAYVLEILDLKTRGSTRDLYEGVSFFSGGVVKPGQEPGQRFVFIRFVAQAGRRFGFHLFTVEGNRKLSMQIHR